MAGDHHDATAPPWTPWVRVACLFCLVILGVADLASSEAVPVLLYGVIGGIGLGIDPGVGSKIKKVAKAIAE